MVIKRADGSELILTDEEVEMAYRFQQLHYTAEDIKDRYGVMYDKPFPYDEDTAVSIANRALDALNKNDMYYQNYWDSVELTIEDFELMGK